MMNNYSPPHPPKDDNPVKSFAIDLASNMAKTTATNIVQNAYKEAVSLLKSKFVAQITVGNFSSQYDMFFKVIRNLDPETFDKYCRVFGGDDFDDTKRLEVGTSYYITSVPEHLIKVFVGDNSKEKTAVCGNMYVTVSIYGSRPYEIRDMLVKEAVKPIKDGKSDVYSNKISRTRMITRSESSLVLYPDVHARIFNGVRRWMDQYEWYRNHGIVHKLGILLYGDPGTGKSSVINAISGVCDNAPIIACDVSKLPNIISQASWILNNEHKVVIVTLEDCDMLIGKRNPSPKKSNKNTEDEEDNKDEKDEALNLLFNFLDGAFSMDGIIFIATTNYIDKLDPAFIRSGRFDIREELKYFDKDMAIKFVERFGYDIEFLNGLNLKYPVQPAFLQALIVEENAKTWNASE